MRNPNDPYGDYTQDGTQGTTPDPYGTIKQPPATPTGANPGGPYTTQNPATPQAGPSSWQSVTPAPGSIAATGSQNASAPAPPGYKRDPTTGLLTWIGTGTPTNVVTPTSTPAQILGLPPGTTGAPSYVNTNDATQAAVWRAFQAKGLSPRDQSDFQYWVDKINSTNGGWSNPDNQKYWLDRMAQASGGVGDYGGGAEAGSGAGATTGQSGDPFLRQALLDRLGQLNQPIDPNSPAIAGPTAAYNLAADRGAQSNNQALAEAAYAGGTLNTGGYGQAQAQARENTATGKATFAGNLMSQADQQRQSALDQLLGIGSGQGLTEELAGGQLGYQYSALAGSMNRDAILAALGMYGG